MKLAYLNSLCQRMNDDHSLTMETLYELVRHARARRIGPHDLDDAIQEWHIQ